MIYKISIITVSKNNLKGLFNTYNSLIRQNNFQFEWIVIDGASTDGTSAWFSNSTFPFKVKYVSEEDSGIYDAMNKGVKLCEGKYVLFLNSGDILYDINVIGKIIGTINDLPNVELILAGFSYCGRNRLSRPLWWRYWSLPTSHQSIIYKKSIFAEFSFNINFRFAGDYDHFLRIYPLINNFLRVRYITSINEKYGSDAYINKVMDEYELSLSSYLSVFLAVPLIFLKRGYIKLRLFVSNSL